MAKQRSSKVAPPSDDVLLKTIELKHTWAVTARWVLMTLAFGLVLWMAEPLAGSIAGKDTNFNVTIGVTFSAALALTNTMTGAYANNQRKKAKASAEHIRELERRLGIGAPTPADSPRAGSSSKANQHGR